MTPEIAVVVPTYRRPDFLRRLLNALAVQTLEPSRWELVVVDNASHDPAVDEVLSQLPDLVPCATRMLRIETNRGPAAARNLGWRYRRVDAASLVVLGSIAGLTFRRARPLALVGLLMGGVWYVHLFRRSHVPPAGVGGYLVAVPLGFVSDSYATLVMLRASLRYRTLLL